MHEFALQFLQVLTVVALHRAIACRVTRILSLLSIGKEMQQVIPLNSHPKISFGLSGWVTEAGGNTLWMPYSMARVKHSTAAWVGA